MGRHPKPDPEKVREQRAEAAFIAYAKSKGLNKSWLHLDAESKKAWKCASDEIASAILSELDGEETFLAMLKMAMQDAVMEDHITQLKTAFSAAPTRPIRLIVCPELMPYDFGDGLKGKHDG